MSKKQLAKDALKSFLKTVKKIKSFDLKKTFTEDGKTYSMLSIIVKHKKGDVPESKLETKSKSDKKSKKTDKVKAKKSKSKSKKKVKSKEVKASKPAPKPVTVNVTIAKTPKPKTSPVAKTKTEAAKPPVVVSTTAKAAPKPAAPKPAAPKPAPALVKAPVKRVTTRTRKPTVGDNLKLIEGIGPKIESFLKEDGIDTFEKLSKAIPDDIQKMLVGKGGTRYNANNPSTWPEQAALAAKGDMEAFNALKLELKGGRKA